MKTRFNKIIFSFTILAFSTTVFAQDKIGKIAFELDSNTTATYDEVIKFYKNLDEHFEEAKLLQAGLTDAGQPLHVLVLSKQGHFSPERARQAGKHILLINNGIHPGEPEGIDASMMLARDLLQSKAWHDDLVICIIPVYNIGGMLNRGVSRANQNGPNAYGFRGNAKNFDLNRDFIKTDSRNSESFQEIFNAWDPDVFMDTHTSNGADYQYVMTLIDTQIDKLHPALHTSAKQLTGTLYQKMESTPYAMVPYVTFRGQTPESGLVSFMETPRYSTGYAALKHTIGYMPETHMWKPYWQRVESTYKLLEALVETTGVQGKEIAQVRNMLKKEIQKQEEFVLGWTLDTSRYENIAFKGYESGQKPSDIHGKNRLYYDRNKPYEREIRYYNRYIPSATVKKPLAYLIPQGWTRVIELLKLNGVQMTQLQKDQVLSMEMYYLEDFQTGTQPYEGHYIHSRVKLRTENQSIHCYKGDFVVHTNQEQIRYLIETLEPVSGDSFFNWNFFDSMLSKKEHYSAYIFEDEAFEMLKNDSKLRQSFEKAKENDEKLRNDPRLQLDWIYHNSAYSEKTFRRYPIGRIIEGPLPK